MALKPRSRIAAISLLSSYAAAASSQSSTQTQSTPTASPTLVGCFSSFKPLVKQDTYQFQSSGHCWGICTDINKAVLGLANGISCWCGDELPAALSKVPDSNCDTPCAGYNLEDCGGGIEYFTVWLTGTESNVQHYKGDGSLSSTSSSTTPATSSTSSVSSQTGSATISSSDSTSSSESSRADNRAQRIRSHGKQRTILGVVLGLTAFTAIVAAALLVWCCMRRRRRRHGGTVFHRRKAPSLSEAPLAANADDMSVISTSTYSSRRSPAFVERTGLAIAAMQHALNPDSRDQNSQQASSAPQQVKKSRPKLQTTSAELDAEGYRGVIDHQSIDTYQSPPFSPTTPSQMQSPLGNIIEQSSSQPKSMSVMVSAEEIISPVSPMYEEMSHKKSRSLMIHYPSWSEVDGFDFSGGAKETDPAKVRQSWHPMRERKDGRYELA